MPRPTFHAEIEWACEHAGVIRVFPAGRTFGDPYLWAATVKRLSPTEAEIAGVTQAPTRVVGWAVAVELARQGFTTLVIERHRGDRVHRLTHDLRKIGR